MQSTIAVKALTETGQSATLRNVVLKLKHVLKRTALLQVGSGCCWVPCVVHVFFPPFNALQTIADGENS